MKQFKLKKIFYNKLIRDRIPEKIKAAGSECETRKLSVAEYERELLKKVSEEVNELLAAKNKKELIAELADVIDVIEEIIRFKKISKEEILEQQRISFEKKGGFKKRLFLVWSSNDGYKTNEKKGGKK